MQLLGLLNQSLIAAAYVRYSSAEMIRVESSQSVPLTVGSTGTIRIAGSRVTLDSVVGRFKQGYTAEEIQESFPNLKLAEVYAVLAYYLEHEHEVGNYLAERERQAQEIRKRWEARPGTKALRQRIVARRARLARSHR